MKKIVSIFLLMLVSAVCLNAQEGVKSTNAAPAANASAAEIQFDNDVHDFGKIKFAGNGTYEFRFKNTGKEPLIITDAKGSCGCTVPTYPKNTPIGAGSSQVIKVTYDTQRPVTLTKQLQYIQMQKRLKKQLQ